MCDTLDVETGTCAIHAFAWVHVRMRADLDGLVIDGVVQIDVVSVVDEHEPCAKHVGEELQHSCRAHTSDNIERGKPRQFCGRKQSAQTTAHTDTRRTHRSVHTDPIRGGIR